MANLGAQAGSGLDASDITTGTLGAVTLGSSVVFPAGKVVGHTAVHHNQSSTQVLISGSIQELDTDLRLTYTAKSSSNKLLFQVYGWFCSPNSDGLSWAYIYETTDGIVNPPPANGSRLQVHWSKRVTASDANDFCDMNFMVYADAPSGAKTYTIYYGTEGKQDQFFVSTLGTSSGVTAPIIFSLTEIQQ